MSSVTAEHRRKAEQLLALHRGPLLLLPNAWDALSAKIFEEAGFRAVATTSAGVAWALGFADGENVSWHELLGIIEELKRQGQTMIIVEQSVNVALAIADRAIFMEKGQVRFEGPAAELAERDDLVRAVFLGAEGG